MADPLITDQEIAILCDVLEGRGANLTPVKKNVLDQLIAKGFVTASAKRRPPNTNLPAKLNNFLPSAALD
jgi:hypothetical protein